MFIFCKCALQKYKSKPLISKAHAGVCTAKINQQFLKLNYYEKFI